MQNKRSKKELTRLILTALILGSGGLYGPVAEAATNASVVDNSTPNGMTKSNNPKLLYITSGAENDTVTVNCSYYNAWENYAIFGGYGNEEIKNRTITLESGKVYKLYGGMSGDYNGGIAGHGANNNTVIITGGTVTGDVYGGFAINTSVASNNTITIEGDGTLDLTNANIHGGGSNNSANNFNNVININRAVTVKIIVGGSSNTNAGNVLNIGHTGVEATGGISGIQKTNISVGFASGETVLSGSNLGPGSLDITGLTYGSTDTGVMTLLWDKGTTVNNFNNLSVTYSGGSGTLTSDGLQVKNGTTAYKDLTGGVRLSYTKGIHTVKLADTTVANGSNKKVLYEISDSAINTVTLGAMTWGTSASASGNTFTNSTTIDASKLTFTGTANAPNASMTLLSGATGITDGHITQPGTGKGTIAANFTDTAGINFVGTAQGTVSVGTGTDADKVLYTLNSGTLTNINLGGWDGTASNIPTNWTGSNVAVATGNFATESIGNVDIFTTDTPGFFNDDYITGNKKYQGGPMSRFSTT